MGQADRTLALLADLAATEDELVRMLAPGRVAVLLGPDVANNPQAQAIVSFAVNLVARLYPVVQDIHVIVPSGTPLVAPVPRWRAKTLDEHLTRFLRALNPPLRWTIGAELSGQPTCALVVGAAVLPSEQIVHVGSDGWEATVSPSVPVLVGRPFNPVGAYAAACLGISEVWKRLLYPHRYLLPGTPIIPSEAALTFSAFTYLASPSQPNPALAEHGDLGRLTMVGLGAGGSAVAFTLASLRGLQAAITQIEPDEVIGPNLNRYIVADGVDAAQQRRKTDVVEELFESCSGVTLRSFPTSYEEAASSLAQEDYRYVLAAVHSREARRSLQYATPMVLWDAGATEQGEFFIWRHIFGTTDCMWCKHPPGEQDPEEQKARQLAQLVDLDARTWLRKVRTNEAFTLEEVTAITQRHSSSDNQFDMPVVGQRYGDWEAAQCGRLALPDIDEGIPVPFAPVIAGVLLAGEVIKQHLFPNAVLDSYYWNTLVGRFMTRNRPYRRRPKTYCSFCSDGAYLGQYRRRWGEAGSP